MDEAAVLQFPLFKSALRRCLGVVVHSEYSRERVVAATSSPVVMLDFPPHGPCIAHAHVTAPRSIHPSGKTRLLTFGVLNSNKLIHKVIEQIGKSRYLRAHVAYTVVGEGEKSYVQFLRDAINAHGLSNVVCLSGRLSDHDLWRELMQADVVVNLRNPHTGESSGSLLNALFAGEVRSAQPVLALTDLLSDRLLEFGTRAPNGLVERLAREVAALAGVVPKQNESLAA